MAMQALPIAQFPDIIPPQITVTATYTGADALTIEQAVADAARAADERRRQHAVHAVDERERRHDAARPSRSTSRPIRTSIR